MASTGGAGSWEAVTQVRSPERSYQYDLTIGEINTILLISPWNLSCLRFAALPRVGIYFSSERLSTETAEDTE